jgi:CheY-like chemotaxis protein
MSTVLVVDDEAGARRALMRLLAQEGYETVGAGDGGEALRALGARAPDVILLDLMMPGMDGLELLEALQGHPQWKALPVVVLTALSDTHTVNRAQQLGARAYLVKATFSVADMLDHVKRYAAGHAAGSPAPPRGAGSRRAGGRTDTARERATEVAEA